MKGFYNYLPVLAVCFPVFASLVVFGLQRYSARARDIAVLIGTGITFALVAWMYPYIQSQGTIGILFSGILPPFGLSFSADIFSFFLALIASGVWLLATIYSREYIAHEGRQNRYYPFLLLTLGGCLGVFLTGDFFSLFIFFELMSFAAYVLIVHEESPGAMAAGYKYLILTLIGGLALFFAIVIAFEEAGNVLIAPGNFLITSISPLALSAFIGFLLGFGIKMGVFPLHIWLPDAHPVAPSPASALLSGVMLKTGAYGLIRVVYNVYGPELIAQAGWDIILMVLASITIFLGSAVALVQTDIKRRLAYSSIGQMGYVLLGISLLTLNGLTGTIFHILAHALMKSALFMCAGAIIFKTGKREISELSGIGYEMPITLSVFTVASLSMIGIPPFNGFISKLVLSLGALDAGKAGFVVLLIVSSLLNGIYFLPIVINGFLGVKKEQRIWPKPFAELKASMWIPLVILAVLCGIFSVLPVNYPLGWAEAAARMLTGAVK
ncbi:MAG: complex I subunit 5 family protein [Bacillota bacterium]|jgi:multicomponent Na+:H+ antiporter subunit D|nr:monovalent cation/H+ antiporter subunit D family protein [Bacillota bacterium]HOC06108.1 proton-conducting transporter membrane subunit [Bacillota bacterium]HPZ21584.1 proton-conducting transporter membrane subunit [Bacillota bacterium]HQD19475.1 proton-conducting transporter membrane subunit [Bacillota bacterium]